MIYLDSAATSYLKPPAVGEAVRRAIQSCASPGRGTHAAAMRGADLVYSCRELAASFFRVPEPDRIVFTLNATHALNLAIRSLVKPGMRVAVSGYEHNAVMRPLYAVGAEIVMARTPLFDPEAVLDFFRQELPRCGAAVCTHVSNVFGFVQPIEEIARLCRSEGVPLIVDAAQSAGILDIDFTSLGAAFIAMPGHKGLLGPQGTGLLLCGHDTEPLLYGGTGSMSERREMPDFLPDRLEAGTLNVCGIAGLREGLCYLRQRGLASVRSQEELLMKRMLRQFSDIPGVCLFAGEGDTQLGVLSLTAEGMGSEKLSELLGRQGIAVRAGLHCAPLAHKTGGTLETGTVRFSLSPFNSTWEIDRAADILKKIIKKSNKL